MARGRSNVRDGSGIGARRAAGEAQPRAVAGRRAWAWALLAASAGLAGCAGGDPERAAALRQAAEAQEAAALDRALAQRPQEREARFRTAGESTIWDLFRRGDGPDTSVEVNRFLWNAALEVLDFLPVEAVDPFSGVIVTGYGTPPGGGTAYRATVYVQDAALDARSLNVALATRAGPAPAATQRAVEDAILTRARQLRIAAGQL